MPLEGHSESSIDCLAVVVSLCVEMRGWGIKSGPARGTRLHVASWSRSHVTLARDAPRSQCAGAAGRPGAIARVPAGLSIQQIDAACIAYENGEERRPMAEAINAHAQLSE